MFRFNPFRSGRALYVRSYVGSPPVAAATDDGETMVVTASAIEQNLERCAKQVSASLPSKILQRRPVQNLKDVLKEVPGVQPLTKG